MNIRKDIPERTGKKNDQIISYYELRMLIGGLGFLLPFLLFTGNLLSGGTAEIEYSISDYYDNGTAGDILVGVLFALGFFLFSYRGYDALDSRAANLGCVFALGVALFPTTSDNPWIHKLHFVFAFLLFAVFIFFSIYLFRRTAPGGKMTSNKENRNRVYLTCALVMIVCVAGITLFSFFTRDSARSTIWSSGLSPSPGVLWIFVDHKSRISILERPGY